MGSKRLSLGRLEVDHAGGFIEVAVIQLLNKTDRM
jgi:hypothetical protein